MSKGKGKSSGYKKKRAYSATVTGYQFSGLAGLVLELLDQQQTGSSLIGPVSISHFSGAPLDLSILSIRFTVSTRREPFQQI